jgi:DNA primase
MGAGKWRPHYNEYFAGKKVIIIPDNDLPGQAHAENIAKTQQHINKCRETSIYENKKDLITERII